jgi:DNA repair photolyase
MTGDESDKVDKTSRRARGAVANPGGRFERHERVRFHDCWDLGEEAPPPLRTEVAMERARSALTRNSSPDLSFDRSVNPYRGCEHGCVYCFARPSHAFLGHSPGLDFETKLTAKPNAAEKLAEELSRKSYACAPIAMGTNTDPYQPIEKKLGITRAILGVLRDFNHPVSVLTKGALITRDADILGPMGAAGLASAGVSLTTLDPALARAMEPRAAAPATRLATIRALRAAGCPVWVSLGPVIPGLNDMEMERLLAAAKEAGAQAAGYVALRLPREVGPIFRDWLAEAYPHRARKVMGLVRQIHGGRDYDPEWGKRMTGEGPIAALIARRFRVATRGLGLDQLRPPLRRDLFRVPRSGPEQLSLF